MAQTNVTVTIRLRRGLLIMVATLIALTIIRLIPREACIRAIGALLRWGLVPEVR